MAKRIRNHRLEYQRRLERAALRGLSKAQARGHPRGGGKATLTTVEGDTLTVMGKGQNISVTDSKGDTAMVTIANVYQSNGVILVVDKVLMPG